MNPTLPNVREGFVASVTLGSFETLLTFTHLVLGVFIDPRPTGEGDNGLVFPNSLVIVLIPFPAS